MYSHKLVDPEHQDKCKVVNAKVHQTEKQQDLITGKVQGLNLNSQQKQTRFADNPNDKTYDQNGNGVNSTFNLNNTTMMTASNIGTTVDHARATIDDSKFSITESAIKFDESFVFKSDQKQKDKNTSFQYKNSSTSAARETLKDDSRVDSSREGNCSLNQDPRVNSSKDQRQQTSQSQTDQIKALENFTQVLRNALKEVIDQNEMLSNRVQNLEEELSDANSQIDSRDKAIVELAAMLDLKTNGSLTEALEQGDEQVNSTNNEDQEFSIEQNDIKS